MIIETNFDNVAGFVLTDRNPATAGHLESLRFSLAFWPDLSTLL